MTASGKARVLIVEDSRLQAAFLNQILTGRGYAVSCASNGVEALELLEDGLLEDGLLEDGLPDIIISDVEMPEMDGYQLCSRIKSDPRLRAIPVILLTALSDPEDLVKGLNCGAENYLTKPFDPDYLCLRLESLLGMPTDTQAGAAEMEVMVGGVKHLVAPGQRQVLTLLVSTFENAVRQNQSLLKANEELNAVQRELARKHLELQMLNRTKNELLGMAAHDLRNPIGAIRGYARLLSQIYAAALDARQKRILQTVERTSDSLLRLVDDLLDVSAIESGTVTLRLEETDLADLLERCIDLHRPLAEAKAIELEIEVEAVPRVRLDADKFEQVLNNLVNNAIKYCHPEAMVSVRLKQDGAWLRLDVEDGGQGIPREELGKLFKPFSRTSVQATGGERSTGLGLAIVKRIVDGHGGRISVASEVGRGSIFTVRVPLAEATTEPGS